MLRAKRRFGNFLKKNANLWLTTPAWRGIITSVAGAKPAQHMKCAAVAHLVERHLAKVEVASSSLVTCSRKRKTRHMSCLSFPGAGDEARTRYLHLGKVALYQMSYGRTFHVLCRFCTGDASYYTAPSGRCQPQICIFLQKVSKPSFCPQHRRLLSAFRTRTRRKFSCFLLPQTL